MQWDVQFLTNVQSDYFEGNVEKLYIYKYIVKISFMCSYYAHIYHFTPLQLFTPSLFYFILLHTYHL